jgi:hypothetical protein
VLDFYKRLFAFARTGKRQRGVKEQCGGEGKTGNYFSCAAKYKLLFHNFFFLLFYTVFPFANPIVSSKQHLQMHPVLKELFGVFNIDSVTNVDGGTPGSESELSSGIRIPKLQQLHHRSAGQTRVSRQEFTKSKSR